MQEETLTNLGLTPEETSVYMSLLENGTQSAIGLGKTSKVKRTYVYKVVQGLIQKGLVSQGKQGRTTVFSPLSPDHLLSLAEEKKQKVVASERMLESILPELKSKFLVRDERPTITYYEGVAGLKKAYLDLLKVGKPISALVQTSKVEPELYNWLTSDFVKQRIDLQIPVRSIVASGDKTQAYVDKNEQELRETKVIPYRDFPLDHEIDIYGDKVSILNNKAGEALLAVIIENKIIAKTFQSWFELTWSKI